MPEQVIEVPKILIDERQVRTPVREPQLAEQLVEVPTLISFSSLQRIAEQDVAIPFAGVRGRLGVLQGFSPDRVQQRRSFLRNAFLSGLWSRSLTFLVEVFKVFALCRVRQRHLLLSLQFVRMMTPMSLVKGVFALFQERKKCEDRSAFRIGTECGL